MKSTKGHSRCRKPSKKGYQRMVGDANWKFAEAHIDWKIDENNNTVSVSLDSNLNLLERILAKQNLNAAYLKVMENNGAGGVDGMEADGLFRYLRENQVELLKSIREGRYKPNPVRRVEIPKDEPGKVRRLGIPTLVDRVFQQAIAQVLTPIYEYVFSEFSYGFRPDRDTHMALKRLKSYADEGYVYVVDMDLAKYFDTVNHSKLMQVLSVMIKDGELLSLINKYLNAGAWSRGMFERTDEGVPQGGPLSPLLGNIMLNELDHELERREHKFVRYADDIMILCKSRRAAERTLKRITAFIERKLFLKVNHEKTSVAHCREVKYLGYGFYFKDGECRFRVHPKSVVKLKKKLHDLLKRQGSMSNVDRVRKWNQKIKGWINYFVLADMKSHLEKTDEWCRRRIRMIYWRQWKRVRTRYRQFRSMGLKEPQVHKMANMRSGPWASALALNSVLTNKWIADLGYTSLSDYYIKRKGLKT